MSALGHRGLGGLLTLGLCWLSLACGGPQAPAPSPPLLPSPTPDPNLLRNAGFFQDASGWEPAAGVPGWRDQAGFLALAVTPAAGPQTAGWSQEVAVRPGASYLASYRVHTEKLAGRADLRLGFYDPAGRLLWETGGVPASGDLPWTTYTWRCRAPDGTVQVRARLVVEGAQAGRAAFDEPSLAPDDGPVARALIVDYTREAGRIRSFQQLSGISPGVPAALLGCTGLGAPGPAIDLAAVFPDLRADPDDPASYDFRASDGALAYAAEAEVELLVQLRIAPSPGAAGLWGAVAQHIARHYNEGWADGYRHGIRYWEVQAGPQEPGQGADCYEALAGTMTALKEYDPTLRVGGPGAEVPSELPFVEGFLGYLAERGQRLDFLSWRGDYDGAPWAQAVAEARVEQLLERYGLGDAEVMAGAWGLAMQPAEARPAAWRQAYEAAHLVAVETYWQDTRLARAYRYWPGSGLADEAGLLTPSGEAFRLLGRFRQSPRRLAVEGGDGVGFTVLAGKSEDGRLVQIAIADCGSRSLEYRLGLAGFPPGYRYLVREISEGRRAAVIAQGDGEDLPDAVLALPWRAPAVHFIELTWGQG